jgi:hypothetical protein
MANRLMKQFRGALEPVVKELFLQVTFGSTGAPTLTTSITLPNQQTVNPSKGIASIVRTGAGAYTINLSDSYVRTMMVNQLFSGAAAPSAPEMHMVADNAAVLASPSIQVQFSSAGVATDPASGDEVLMQIVFCDSTAP